ncbi:hypothetical protein LBMAG56_49500 [Verrucomicrobiota bacterium]|nr:hypothetical protein LBMAG56_49500 [Verrucomicrobiota bacterium]
MKIYCFRACLVAWVLLLQLPFNSFGQGTAFSYQGRLSVGGTPATGTYQFEFTLWDSLSGGVPASAVVLTTPAGVSVSNGLFTVILDFGAGALNGAPRCNMSATASGNP